jgi:hypothetical protein
MPGAAAEPAREGVFKAAAAAAAAAGPLRLLLVLLPLTPAASDKDTS